MSKRFAWLLGLVVLVLIALLIACQTTYNPASDGLVVVTSQGSSLIETFSFDLASGSIEEISNPVDDTSTVTCVMPGIPSSIVLDPAGTYAYTIVTNVPTDCPGQTLKTGIESFQVNSDGTIADTGTFFSDPNPMALAMDLSGKYLFVAEGGVPNVYSIGSGGTLTLVPGTFNFVLPNGFQTPDMAALMPTPTIFPVQNAICSAPSAPASQEFLYVADSQNNVVYEFGVDESTGALQNPPGKNAVEVFPVGPVPSGVAVDPCNRFVYVSNLNSNQISAFTICNGSTTSSSTHCPIPPAVPDGTLVAVAGSPFNLSGNANGPGPMVVDALGNFLYVLNTLSNSISPFRISPVNGGLVSQTPVGVGNTPKSIAIRSDDSWLFVTNFNSFPPDLSEFAISPATGTLTPVPVVYTDNYPWGVAVK